MLRKPNRFGVGPRIMVPALAFAAVAWGATRLWPQIFRLPAQGWMSTAGLALIILGFLLLPVAGHAVTRAHASDRLVTSGAFAVVRHPIYAAWIVLILPGLALLCGSWPMLIAPLLAYVRFRQSIHGEEDYLLVRFGPEYAEYRSRVNRVWPVPRFQKR